MSDPADTPAADTPAARIRAAARAGAVEEAARLASEEGRDRFAKVLSRAIRIYFARSAEG